MEIGSSAEGEAHFFAASGPVLLSLTAYHCKGRQAGRDLHLHVDRAGLDPLKGDGRNPLNHARPSLPSRTIRGSRARSLLQEQYGNGLGGPEGPNQS